MCTCMWQQQCLAERSQGRLARQQKATRCQFCCCCCYTCMSVIYEVHIKHYTTWPMDINPDAGSSNAIFQRVCRSAADHQLPQLGPRNLALPGPPPRPHSLLPLYRFSNYCLCRLLGVAADASQSDIKSAYRKAALKTHPDVSNAPDATQQFSQLSSAYGECLAAACCICSCCQ